MAIGEPASVAILFYRQDRRMEKNNKWYKEFTDRLELTGLRPRTIDIYSRAVKQLQDHYNKKPVKITEKTHLNGHLQP